jgi:hypothetical protein
MTAAVLARDTPAHDAPPTPQREATRIDDEWIVLAAGLPRTCALSPWQALLWNAELTGPVKLVLPPGARNIEIRAELPVDEGADVDARLCEAQTAVRRVAVSLPQQCNNAAAGLDEAHAIDLGAVAEEGGWSFVQRSSGRIAVDLGVPDQFCQAIVEPRGGGCRARVVLAAVASPSERARSALAVLLLTVTASVRMVRAGASERDGETTAFVEADVTAPASAWELQHALAALAVACRMGGREAKVLADDRLADLYLAARGWAASP